MHTWLVHTCPKSFRNMARVGKISLLLLLFALTTATLAQRPQSVDLTVRARATGVDVVTATISRIEDTSIFTTDRRLLRRIAFVETRDGENLSSAGGIWNVREDDFERTRDSNQGLDTILARIGLFFQSNSNIRFTTWRGVRYSNLDIPLLSALAARLVIALAEMTTPIPTASNITGQAIFWRTYYNSDGDVDMFREDVELLVQDEACTVNSDIIFVLDSSGSIGNTNYEQVIEFTREFAGNLDIGPTTNQVGVILFGSNAQVEFNLTTHSNNVSLLTAINNLPYLNSATNTADGLCLLLEEGFSEQNGARVSAGDIFRLAIVLTDGQSNTFDNRCGFGSTMEAAEAVQNFDPPILVFAIGVTNNVNNAELEAIATRDELITLLTGFEETLFIETMDEQMYELCARITIPVEVGELNGTLAEGANVRYELDIPEDGVTVRLCVREGFIILYASYTVTNPNEALHDIRREVISTGTINCDDAFIPPENPGSNRRKRQSETDPSNSTVYLSLVGVEGENGFNVETTEGDTTVEAPVVSVSPENICANKSDEVMFICSATGGPGNTFRWENASSGELLTNEEILTVCATKTREYICTVENEAGSDYGNVTLSVLPVIVEDPLSTVVVEGGEIQLTCVFEGQPTIAWFHDEFEINADDNYRVCIEEDTSVEHKVRSTLYIWNAMKFDKGDYACIATETFCDPVFSAPAVVEIRCVVIPIWLWPLLQGQSGPDGRDGEVGQKGWPGETGHSGPPGVMGPGGEKGMKGSQGSTGAMGRDGAKGNTGEKGEAGDPGDPGMDITSAGVVYTAWGLADCPATTGTTTLSRGLMSASRSTDTGSGTNYLCLPNNPNFANSTNPSATIQASVVGVKYNTTDEPLQDINNMAAACSVCSTPQAVHLMIPGSAVCPSGHWRREYSGYLMSARDTPSETLSADQVNSHFRTEYVCIASNAVGVPFSSADGDDAELFHVHLDCEAGLSLACSARDYSTDLQLTCAICTLNPM